MCIVIHVIVIAVIVRASCTACDGSLLLLLLASLNASALPQTTTMSLQRPSGPRIQRSPSPLPAPTHPPPPIPIPTPPASDAPNGFNPAHSHSSSTSSLHPDVPPLNIRGRPLPPSLSIHMPATPPPPPSKPQLQLPLLSDNPDASPAPSVGRGSLHPLAPSPRPKPRTPRLNISAIPTPHPRSTDSDSPPYSYYGGGPVPPPQTYFEGGDVPTIRPPLPGRIDTSMGLSSNTNNNDDNDTSTCTYPGPSTDRPHIQTVTADPLADLNALTSTIREIGSEEIHAGDTYRPEEWSDDMFEDIVRLGEGAGGAVHKVKVQRTGEIMARKTITTRETPPKQLLRELQFMRTTVHHNICKFYGAYISPSSSEVKVLMEVCEGGSLEAVGKRIRELGGRISEKVASRLAEGVSMLFHYIEINWIKALIIPFPVVVIVFLRYSRVLPISIQEELSTVTSSRQTSY